jgi:hypothetical protein
VAMAAAVAELATAKCYGLAGALVMQHHRVPAALATTDASLVMLERYLREQSKAKPSHAVAAAAAALLPALGGTLCDCTPQACKAAMSSLVKDLQHA